MALNQDAAPVTLSVIVPMYNATRVIGRCLEPLRRMLERGEIIEIVVVDDCSSDDSPALVEQVPGIRLMRRARRGGPGAARNDAARHCSGTYLWFVDSDVVVADDAARELTAILAARSPAAINGSYDDQPDAPNFLSQYKNLVHHYFHNRSREEAVTFWAGCGAVERETFLALDGFDGERYPFPSVEDIELGYRIQGAGGTILMAPRVRGKHLKEWRFVNLVHTEVFRRAIPWSRLILARTAFSRELNLSVGERVRAGLAGLGALWIAAWALQVAPAWPLLPLGAMIVRANLELITFFHRKRGPWFAARALAFHQIYYLYSSAAYAATLADIWFWRVVRGRIAEAPRRPT